MTRFDADLLRQAPQLRYILQFGVGLEVRLLGCTPSDASF